MIPAQFKVDIFSEINRICEFPYEIIIIDKTLKELKKLNEGNGKKARAAKLALKLLKQKHTKIIKTLEAHADDAILEVVGNNYIVATQDQELKKRLKKKHIKIITLRSKGHLIFQ